MTMELSVERILTEEDAFEIVLKDIGGTFDVDQHRSLRERGGNLYQSLLVIERDPESEALMGDLDALQSYPRGVYVLIDTKLRSDNKWKVFVGTAGSSEEIINICRVVTDSTSTIGVADNAPTLAECLDEQNKKCPPKMKEWDLAVIIPEEKNTFLLFAALFSIFKKAECFTQFKDLNGEVSIDLYGMHSVCHYLLKNSRTQTFLSHSSIYISDPNFWISILGLVASLPGAINFFMDKIRNRRERKMAKELEGKYTFLQKSGDINNKNKGDSNATLNTTGDINISIVINVSAEHLNKNLPRE